MGISPTIATPHIDYCPIQPFGLNSLNSGEKERKIQEMKI
tara:strand:- start:2973 stop:3092 length:120 start_codon:yes stop_codon:yes gene_type:complete